jgi:16S rRNA G527 N7-methylase RsmG
VSDQTEHLDFDIESVLSQFKVGEWLDRYWDILSQENRKVNLVSRETDAQEFRRMVAESLLPFAQLRAPYESYLDIGSGGGLPAIPILLSGTVSGPTFLFERTKKKAVALNRIVSALGIKRVKVFPESFGEKPVIEKFALVTLSYVSLTQTLLNSIGATLKPGGVLVYYSRPDFSPTGLTVRTHSYSHSAADIHKRFSLFVK